MRRLLEALFGKSAALDVALPARLAREDSWIDRDHRDLGTVSETWLGEKRRRD